MDKRKDTLSTLKICRFCLTQDVPLASIYDKKRKLKNGVNLPLKILSCVSVEVFPSDKMPSYICEKCRYFMNICYDFKQICRQADESILHYIQDSSPLKAVTWPVSLNEAYCDSNDIGVVKTVVEDGTTVQITHDMSDSEDEEEENVYNVKVNDGSDEVSKTFVKVVASRDNGENKEAKQKVKEAEERSWPCDQCNCSYPFQQLLELHIMRKHRERTVECDQCDAKFFTKYDLAIHQLRHSAEMPFECGACDKRFRRQILLNRHVKARHADLAKHVCKECPAVFISQEELHEHWRKHEQQPALLKCTMCDKKMNQSSMQRHIQSVHERIKKFSCDYCHQRFSTATTLSRHIRAHAGDKPYPCKYCDKTFTKSHHATRHQRLKHPDELQRDSVGHVEQLRCEQCGESFSNQDELIYHSAIHATQNLTCPLCQEKFHNVDAVTTHIKSHVNGVEFMCEFCELVFTSKEKLDGHMERAHEDELQHELSTEHQDDSSNEMEDTGMECDEEEDSIHVSVKEEDDHMVVEIKKAGDFMLKKPAVSVPTEEHKTEGSSHSEGESGSETEYAAATPAAIEQLATVKKISPKPAPKELVKPPASVPVQVKPVVQAKPSDQAVLIRKTEEIKRASPQTPGSPAEKKEKPVMAQVTKIENSNDKSLRLLEKELQDLKRTNSRSEAVKTPVNTPRPKGRPPLHSSTPKTKKGIYRPVEEKKTQVVNKPPVVEKKPVEKKITKENKEPKEIKEVKANNKEEKDNAQKNNKSIIKNGTSEKTGVEDGVRRSTRPSKIKDYAKMIRVNSQDDSESDELADDDEEYKEGDKTAEMGRVKARRSSVRPAKSSPAPSPAAAPAPAAPAAPPRKRGRPRKEPPPGQETPAKTKKIESELAQEKPAEVEEKPEEAEERKKDSEEPRTIDEEPRERISQKAHQAKKDVKVDETQETSMSKAEPEPEKASETKERPLPVPYQITYDPGPSTSDAKIITPIVPSLKKVPIRSLPPGVKPLPLPLGRSSGELCEMQIGKKVVKVQKIVMTKAEVEAMAKQGLVEMKDGTMVLKQGIKLPKVESVKAVAAETEKESPTKKDKAAPTRCDFDDE